MHIFNKEFMGFNFVTVFTIKIILYTPLLGGWGVSVEEDSHKNFDGFCIDVDDDSV